MSESEALSDLYQHIKQALHQQKCSKAVMVAHNTFFDQSFYQAAIKRCQLQQQDPFHAFTAFDTATLGGLAFGQTVFSKAVKAAGLPFDEEQAHSAKYDAEQTAHLFCHIVNHWQTLGGWSG